MRKRRCYISKNYPNLSTGGNKAKTDIEKIMDDMNFINLGINQSINPNKVKGFIYTLYSVLKSIILLRRHDILVLQYPFKKYYTLICISAHLKGAKVVTLIHDLGAFRRKKLSTAKEKKRLGHSDCLIALNSYMKEYLLGVGYQQPITILGMWDYLSLSKPQTKEYCSNKIPEVIYAGSLSHKKHSFIYKLDECGLPMSYTYNIYGGDFDQGSISNKNNYKYSGFVQSDDLITTTTGDYGLVWYGHSINEIDGVYGEYLQITTAHKPSLYICCHIPLIVWSKSAQATFVRENNIGICIDSLAELDERLPKISIEEYNIMKENAKKVSQKLESGYYFKQAYLEAEEILKK